MSKEDTKERRNFLNIVSTLLDAETLWRQGLLTDEQFASNVETSIEFLQKTAKRLRKS